MFPDLLRDDIFRLETKRLWLRWPRIADSAAIVRLAGDKDVAQMTARIPHPYPQGAADRWIFESRVGNAQGSAVVLAMTLKEKPGELIGVIGVHQTRSGRALLGYWLGKSFWGQGLMTEATQTLVDLAFRTSEVEKIETHARVDNPRSCGVLLNAGFVVEGEKPVDMAERGGVFVCRYFGLDREAWQARQTAPLASGDLRVAC
ncbi:MULTISPECIES: GNAT family N-acetyltransferase [unclassified Beijerinckia]|uniref:GNAT family N-acetyltransferase n=1 Tax=unclassified Beijerinckia TaxID=2638183 RepID=UPI0008961EB7|nr:MULTISPECIES: GNAT family N-acetyltransferase [unclassified Beijerinckia]MDH7798276.1 RimJ/RimL family protein N-acetyltransferase [Beijerinckia sp. GAS462]SED15333.1 Protein N-acetyltransferase, RimJ/RimL family [Beijerinckia sp. 28-YEA-48]